MYKDFFIVGFGSFIGGRTSLPRFTGCTGECHPDFSVRDFYCKCRRMPAHRDSFPACLSTERGCPHRLNFS
jgi:hypothetical protein